MLYQRYLKGISKSYLLSLSKNYCGMVKVVLDQKTDEQALSKGFVEKEIKDSWEPYDQKGIKVLFDF